MLCGGEMEKMNNVPSEEEIRQTLAKVPHPEINNTLMNLGMIADIAVTDGKAVVTMALPFLGIPIRDYIINSVQQAIASLGTELEIEVKEMNEEQRNTFLAKAKEGWIG